MSSTQGEESGPGGVAPRGEVVAGPVAGSTSWRARLAPFGSALIVVAGLAVLLADAAVRSAPDGGEPIAHLALLGFAVLVAGPLALLAGAASTVLGRRSNRGRGLVVAAQILHVLAALAAGALVLGVVLLMLS